MIKNNVIHRVFYLRYEDNAGTCFTIDIDGRQYFVTARHVVSDLTESQSLSI